MDLRLLGNRIANHDLAAKDVGTRHAELLAEQLLREAMPDPQRTLEHELRTEAVHQQHIDQAARERQVEPLVPSLQVDLELDHPQRSIERDRP